MGQKLFFLSTHSDLRQIQKNPLLCSGKYFEPTDQFVLHRDGRSSLVFSPQTAPQIIIKARKQTAFGVVPYPTEFNRIHTLQYAPHALYRTPTALDVCPDPQILLMGKLGGDYDSSPEMRRQFLLDGPKIGHAVGHFAAFTYRYMDGLLPQDLRPDNITKETTDDRVGIIDMGGLSKAPIEKMLFFPILHNPLMAAELARTFSELTGLRFKMPLIEKKLPTFLPQHYSPLKTQENLQKIKRALPSSAKTNG